MDGAQSSYSFDIPRVTAEWRGYETTFRELTAGLDGAPLSTVILFASPKADLDALTAGLKDRFPLTLIVGCTTAGEIGYGGYRDDCVVAVGLPSSRFCVEPVVVEDLSVLESSALSYKVLAARNRTTSLHPDFENEFAMLLVDGLSEKEDLLVNALTPALGPVPLFGGSAGDALEFRKTRVSLEGRSFSGGAVVLMLRTSYALNVFRFDNFEPTSSRMVVTSADAEARIVHEINGEVAAREYARLVGKNPDALSPFIFASNPVVVKVGGQFHVRSIQQVEPNGNLKFFSAIDEGLVLTVAQGVNIAQHLADALNGLCEAASPVAIIGCDCVFRRLDAEQSQQSGAVSRLLSKHNIVGFSTYGEQFNGLHVNQTLTGVAFYEPLRGRRQ